MDTSAIAKRICDLSPAWQGQNLRLAKSQLQHLARYMGQGTSPYEIQLYLDYQQVRVKDWGATLPGTPRSIKDWVIENIVMAKDSNPKWRVRAVGLLIRGLVGSGAMRDSG